MFYNLTVLQINSSQTSLTPRYMLNFLLSSTHKHTHFINVHPVHKIAFVFGDFWCKALIAVFASCDVTFKTKSLSLSHKHTHTTHKYLSSRPTSGSECVLNVLRVSGVWSSVLAKIIHFTFSSTHSFLFLKNYIFFSYLLNSLSLSTSHSHCFPYSRKKMPYLCTEIIRFSILFLFCSRFCLSVIVNLDEW